MILIISTKGKAVRTYSLAIVTLFSLTGALYAETKSTEDYEMASYCFPLKPVEQPKVKVQEPETPCSVNLKEPCKKPLIRDVRVDEPKNCFLGYFTISYVQPSATNMHYAAEALPLPVPTPNWIIHEIKPCLHVAFDVGVTGVINSAQTFVNINWRHLCSFDSDTVTVAQADMVGPFFTIGPDASAYSFASGKVNHYMQEGRVNYGTPIKVGDKLSAAVYMGVNYAYLSQTLEFAYSNASSEISRNIYTPSTFSGAGPQLGTSLAFHIIDSLDLAMGGSLALLYGCISNSTKYESTSPLLAGLDITPPNTQTTTTPSTNQMIPSFDGQAGFAFNKVFDCCCSLFVEAGFRAQLFLGAFQSVDMGSEVPIDSVADSTVGVYARTFQKNISNFALAGPYLSISLEF